MKKILAAFFVVLWNASASAQNTQWQFTLQYDRSSISVAQVGTATGSKQPSHPGMHTAVETRNATVVWYNRSKPVYSAEVKIPFGNRYREGAAFSVEEGATIVRARGPNAGAVDRIEIQMSDKTLSYDLTRKLTARSGVTSSQKVLDTGPDSNRFVMAVMGDGYRASDITSGKYATDVQTIISYLQSQSPWDELLKVTNIYVVNVESNEAGADDPISNTTVDTYFNTSFNVNGIDRLLAPDSSGEARAFAAADQAAGPGVWDVAILLVNTTKYGGSGGTLGTISMHTLAPEIAVHEFGHTIAGLADEYSDPYPGYPPQVTEPNVDTDGENPKWSNWLTRGVPLPTPDEDQYDSVVGAFEGARYQTAGVYRPKRYCKMKELGVAFCPVCKESIIQSVLVQMPALDGFSPSNSVRIALPARGKTFKLTPSQFGTTTATWKLCGKVLSKRSKNQKITPAMMTRKNCPLVAMPEVSSSLLKNALKEQSVKWRLKK